MKKLFILCLTLIFSTGIFAAPLPATSTDPSAKILKLFHENFPEVTNHAIYNLGDCYMVYFKNEITSSSCRIYYDTNGNVLETIRYYTGEQLAPFIRAKIVSRYKGKTIFMVTDLTNDSQHYYQIILQDSKSLFIVHAEDNGSMRLEKKYRKA